MFHLSRAHKTEWNTGRNLGTGKQKRKPTAPHLRFVSLSVSRGGFGRKAPPCDFVLLIGKVGYLREADISEIQAHSMGTGGGPGGVVRTRASKNNSPD